MDDGSTHGNEAWNRFERRWIFPETSEGVGRRLDRALRSSPALELSGSGASQAAKEDLSIKKFYYQVS